MASDLTNQKRINVFSTTHFADTLRTPEHYKEFYDSLRDFCTNTDNPHKPFSISVKFITDSLELPSVTLTFNRPPAEDVLERRKMFLAYRLIDDVSYVSLHYTRNLGNLKQIVAKTHPVIGKASGLVELAGSRITSSPMSLVPINNKVEIEKLFVTLGFNVLTFGDLSAQDLGEAIASSFRRTLSNS